MMMSNDFAEAFREFVARRGTSYRQLAVVTFYSKSYLHDLASGKKAPTIEAAERLDRALNTGGELAALVHSPAGDDEIAAIELARRVAATDVSDETLIALELAFDDLATDYSSVPPTELLPRVRRHLAYAAKLLDGRMTLAQHRRLLVLNGWLSLLAATVHIDLRNAGASKAHLSTAAQLARHAEHAEIQAWCLETRAWEVLTDGHFPQAIDLAQQAQRIAPRGSSARIQATAQEGRAWARMHEIRPTRRTLARVARLVNSLQMPERPEHHYRYDPSKALAYTATTLAWAGDPAAEEYTRAVIVELEADGSGRPRRVASARLDLGLALLATDQPDEAAAMAILAVSSGRVVPSNWWRVDEILAGVEHTGIPELAELRDAYETFRPSAK